MTTIDVAEDSAPSGAEIGLTLKAALGLATAEEQRLARLLAVAVSCTPDELMDVQATLWQGDALASQSVEDFLALPLVERVGERVRIVHPLDVVLARDFEEATPDGFTEAHEAFARIEATRAEAAADADELRGWETHARIAYYLLRVDSQGSNSQFIDAFDESPVYNRRTCRLWLADLAARYSSITSESTRVGDFFNAFRLYTAQDYDRARVLFEALLDSDRSDKVAAVALHLLALCLDRRTEEDRRHDLLMESVSLSSELGLHENLLMSRNSLIFLLVDRSQRLRDRRYAQSAAELARQNDQLADQLSLPIYQTATRRARAICEWVETASSMRYGRLEDVLGILSEAKTFAEAAHDLAAWVRAAMSESAVLREVGDVSQALSAMETAVLKIEYAAAVPELPRRQFDQELDRVLAAGGEQGELDHAIRSLSRRFRKAASRRWS